MATLITIIYVMIIWFSVKYIKKLFKLLVNKLKKRIEKEYKFILFKWNKNKNC